MARVHVLDSSGPTTRLVFHIAIPATGNNSAGTQWRTAVRWGVLPRTSVMAVGTNPGQILTAENTQLANGEIHEVVQTVDIAAGLSVAQANAALDELHADRTAALLAKLQEDLKYFGFTRM